MAAIIALLAPRKHGLRSTAEKGLPSVSLLTIHFRMNLKEHQATGVPPPATIVSTMLCLMCERVILAQHSSLMENGAGGLRTLVSMRPPTGEAITTLLPARTFVLII